jgi:hypothetical protein
MTTLDAGKAAARQRAGEVLWGKAPAHQRAGEVLCAPLCVGKAGARPSVEKAARQCAGEAVFASQVGQESTLAGVGAWWFSSLRLFDTTFSRGFFLSASRRIIYSYFTETGQIRYRNVHRI